MAIEGEPTTKKTIESITQETASRLNRYLSDSEREQIISETMASLSSLVGEQEARKIIDKINADLRTMWGKIKPSRKPTR